MVQLKINMLAPKLWKKWKQYSIIKTSYRYGLIGSYDVLQFLDTKYQKLADK